jgi:uncharacterized protein (DUF2141 family)
LYENHNDSVVYKQLPDYFSKTKEDGSFEIKNVRSGKYQLIALKDANNNYKYDEGESIGFVNDLADADSSKMNIIYLFEEPAKKIFLKKFIHDEYGKITLVFNKGSDSLRAENLSPKYKGIRESVNFSKTNDTLIYRFVNFSDDSISLLVSNGNKVLDTVNFKVIKKEEAMKSRKNPLRLSLNKSPNGNQSFDLNTNVKLLFNHPIASVNLDEPIKFTRDSIYNANKLHCLTFQPRDQVIELVGCDSTASVSGEKKISINQLLENSKYHLFIPPGTITDFYGFVNDSITIDFKTREEKFYGSLKLKINLPHKGSYILQLLDESENIVRENRLNESATINYNYLYPRTYKLKLVVDENANGKWDGGNFSNRIQPEKVIYNNESINLRSNWDLDLDWKINFKN